MTEPRFPNAKRRRIPKVVADAVFARDGQKCCYCQDADATELDHIHPWAAGGSSEVTNLAASCRLCNRLAGDRVFGEFVAKRDWVRRCRAAIGPDQLRRIADALERGDEALAKAEMIDDR